MAVFAFSSYPFQFLEFILAFLALLAKLYAEHPDVFPAKKLEGAARMVLDKKAKVESTAIRQMREEVKELFLEKE